MYFQRTLAAVIQKSSKSFPVVMLTGARQTGKTTLLKNLDPKRTFVTLDDLDLRRLAKEDPKLFLERFPPPVFIDEFQYAPEILPYIKIAVDEKRTRLAPCRGDFWLSGSQNFSMMENIQESLAGRVAILQLFGFSLAEINQDKNCFKSPPFFEQNLGSFKTKKTLKELFQCILHGDKPSLYRDPKTDKNLYYSSYIQTYLERDVRQILGVKDLPTFEKFTRALAGRMGQILNMANLANDIGVSIPTIKSWVATLERSYQIYLLYPYYRNFNKRLIKTPKIYFYDTGLAAHLLKWHDTETALAGSMAGNLFENWVVSEIVKSYWHRGQDPRLYFWRTRDGLEIDLLHDANNKLYPAEIKLASSPSLETTTTVLNSLKHRSPIEPARIICASRENFPIGRDMNLVSAWSLA